ncbi:DHA2 family efflux MFS transporter permease subunit [Kaistia dalseonensis]|uniref:EmrB/QacA subfamily drug resistance transporter n=1 Tax=Kaistia dalseonensis TaxID=410840 RepID=A0ABU0H5N9_9HYPH|nr:DHA2 family efflux MFS transporter permease subunit [Kaistia dalseonensis]MCX5494249.1 DHA2 family efflux MFS transporter permease subunit [Kaistia dalseonensis]MDQ0436829.1 EmrB/QacA subfamily drug resistance transporter [Kaistia dalseonensis]
MARLFGVERGAIARENASVQAAGAKLPAPNPWPIVAITCIGSAMGQFDASVVQLALPDLAVVFQTRETMASWVALAYVLAFSAALPVFGRLCEMFGRKRLYLAGILVFALASALCATATTLGELIFFRVLQGIGGASLGANSIVILTRASGKELRARAMGYFSAAQAVGVSLGPIVGGLLLGAFGWQSIFWVTVPLGIIGALLGWIILPDDTERDPRPFDWQGALMLGPALACLVLVLNHIADWGIASLPTISFTIGGIALLVLFVWRERRTPSPLLDLHIFSSQPFSLGVIAVLLSYALLYGMFYLMSYAAIRGLHESPERAGLRLSAVPIALGIAAPFAGALVKRHGTSTLALFGMVLAAIALLTLSLVALESTPSRAIGMVALAVFGAGLGFFMAPNNSATMGAAPPALSGEAGALINLARMLGVSLGIASCASMLHWRVTVITAATDPNELFFGDPILGAVETSFALLLVLAMIAAIATWLRRRLAPES